MLAKLKVLIKSHKGRYVIVGGSVYCIELASILLAQKLGAGPIAAVGISYWIGLVFSFIAQKVITFNDKRLHHKVLLPQIFAFATLVLFNFGFTILATKLLAGLLPLVVIRTLALGITVIWNYYLYKTRIFVSDEELPF
jgi:putative flippase GtrA